MTYRRPNRRVPDQLAAQWNDKHPVGTPVEVRAGRANVPVSDRLPPWSEEAERGVVGCCLLSPPECVAECVTRFGSVAGQVFYDLRHQTAYECLAKMSETREAIDLITVQNRLKLSGQLEEIGGVDFLSHLMESVPSASNLSYYLEIVWEKHLLRSMLRALTEGERAIRESETDAGETLDGIEAAVLGVNERTGSAEASTMRELVVETNDLIDGIRRGVGLIGGIRTHFGYFDKMTGGLHRKEMAVVAARPSTGKTSWMLNMAVNVASREQVPAVVLNVQT